MTKVLFVVPLHGNGGIVSWAKKMLKTFPNDEFQLIPVSVVRKAKNIQASKLVRIFSGILDVISIKRNLYREVKNNKIAILHLTTSGSLGTYRDRIVGRFCKKHKLKSIIHCHYGSMNKVLAKNNYQRDYLLKTLALFDQIWVLDKYTNDALKEYPSLRDRVIITPNSIDVESSISIAPKDYNNYLFLANIVPTKGIYETIEAVKQVERDIKLYIAGPAIDSVKVEMKNRAGLLWGNKIEYLGQLTNDKALDLMNDIDVLILPTYYSGEAFPISILEAMSRGKLVISCPRAAIPDMLTAIDGTQCGVLVAPKSSEELRDAIVWCQQHSSEADKMCRKAYEKVSNSYKKEVVYGMYRDNYRKLID